MFDREICVLLAILTIFSSTYILRGVFELEVNTNLNSFRGMIYSLLVGLICDFTPLMLLMTFHYKNFHQKVVEQAPDPRNSYEETASIGTYETMHLPVADKQTVPESARSSLEQQLQSGVTLYKRTSINIDNEKGLSKT